MADPDFGETLYRTLSALYRTRDVSGDLRRLLTGPGALLDAVHATLRQRLADNYPDNPPDDRQIAAAQDWLLPYFAELLDTRLVSPFPDGRRDELERTIRWRQGKGSLGVVESVVEGLGQTEAVVQEGWQRVATTPRIGQPLIAARSHGYATEPLAANPGSAARHPGLPAATVDFRSPSRAVITDQNNPGARNLTIDGATLIWRQGSRHGAPCFPGSYQDVSHRTPDLRSPGWRAGHFHPRRVLAFVPPAPGFFPAGQASVAWTNAPTPAYRDLIDVTEPEPGLRVHRAKGNLPVRVTGAVNLDAATPAAGRWRFEGIVFAGQVRSNAAPVEFVRSAASAARITGGTADMPMLDAIDSLFGDILATGFPVKLVGVTVLNRLFCGALLASEALLLGRIAQGPTAGTPPPETGCLRFSAIRADQDAGDLSLHAVTREAAQLYATAYGDRGCGVLGPASHPSILTGAEDEGEIGAFHHARHAQARAAIESKLDDLLPSGIEAVLVPDATMTVAPYSFT